MKNKSILVIDTPKDCGHCLLSDFIDGDSCLCRKADRKSKSNEKPNWCPLRHSLKDVSSEFYIYDRQYLFDNLDREIDLLKGAKAFEEFMKAREEE